MPVTLHINGQSTDAPRGTSVFDCAEGIGIQVPTSCRKNGKCKECIVEVAEGMNLLSPATDAEEHLKGTSAVLPVRLSPLTPRYQCPRCPRQMRIERHALGLPTSGKNHAARALRPRDGDRILLDGRVSTLDGPIHGHRMDLGTTTGGPAPHQPRDRRLSPTRRSRTRSGSAART